MKNKAFLFQVDAFTKERFKGNPAGVCILKDKIDESLMQSIAMEMNLSETAFLYPLEDKDISECSRFNLRWFTPATEVLFCGHATLSASHILFKNFNLVTNKIIYESISGLLYSTNMNSGDKEVSSISIDFPKAKPMTTNPEPDIIKALDLNESYCIETQYCDDTKFLLIEIENENQLKALKPDFKALFDAKLSVNATGLIITSKSSDEYDFISRCFAPWDGIDEDPVTGSAHMVLGVYWEKKLKKDKFKAYQASKRGGELIVKIVDDRVHIIGNAVTVFESEILV